MPTPLTPALGRQRQAGLCGFKSGLVCRVSPGQPEVCWETRSGRGRAICRGRGAGEGWDRDLQRPEASVPGAVRWWHSVCDPEGELPSAAV